MKLISKPSLRIEDFSGQADWISKLFTQINPFFQSVNQILNGQIDFKDNIQAVEYTYDIAAFAEFSLAWPFNGTMPATLTVLKAYNVVADAPTILLAAWNYDASKRVVNVKNMFEVTSTGNSRLTTRFKFNVRITI